MEPINSSRMPWFKDVDVRVTKGLRVGSLDWTLFAESKNLFNWRNVVSIFAETGDVQNAVFEKKFLDEQTALLAGEGNAARPGTQDANGDFSADLSAPGVCARWPRRRTGQPSSASSGSVDCAM